MAITSTNFNSIEGLALELINQLKLIQNGAHVKITYKTTGTIQNFQEILYVSRRGNSGLPDGEVTPIVGDYGLTAISQQLRLLCYKQDVGTFYKLEAYIDADGEYKVLMDYDSEPVVNGLFLTKNDLVKDMELFPVTGENMKPWFKNLLTNN